MFLKNAWYVAAWGTDVSSELQQIRILGEKVCIFRTDSGGLIALEDACPHRKLPLSKGRIKGDTVECGYHGLTFDCTGQCVAAPGKGDIPPNARVRSYPVHERYGLIWIWMGDASRADTDDIFVIEHYEDPAWGINRGASMDIKCNYLLMTDNLLDPTHVAWVHQSSFAQDAAKDAPLSITKKDDGVAVHRWMLDVEPAPFYKKIIEFEGNCDRLQHYEVRYPCLALIRAIFAPTGTGAPDDNHHDQTFIMDSYNFMTPISETETRYFWFQLRNIRPDDEDLSDMMSNDVREVFEEDVIILENVQVGMTEMTTPNIDLSIDGGQLGFRRQLSKMIAKEHEEPVIRQ